MGQSYQIINLAPQIGTNAHALGINNKGQIAGCLFTSDGVRGFLLKDTAVFDLGVIGSRAETIALSEEGEVAGVQETTAGRRGFLYENGERKDLGISGSRESVPKGINRSKHIVGYLEGSVGREAFFLNGTSLEMLPSLGGTQTVACALNDTGEIVGYSFRDDPFSKRAVTWRQGSIFDLNELITDRRWNLADAIGINNRGDVIGLGICQGQREGFLQSGNAVIRLGNGYPGDSAIPLAINALSEIVGSVVSSNGVSRAFLWRNGLFQDLNSLVSAESGWRFLNAASINDRGEIVGDGILFGAERPYLLKPRSRESEIQKPQDNPVRTISLVEDVTSAVVLGEPTLSPQAVLVSVDSSDERLVSRTNVTLIGIAGDRAFSIISNPNANGSLRLAVVLADGALLYTNRFFVKIHPVNDMPTFALRTNLVTAYESGPQTFSNFIANVSPGPANESNQTVRVTVRGWGENAFKEGPLISPDGGLHFTFAEGVLGTNWLEVVVEDSGGTNRNGINLRSEIITLRVDTRRGSRLGLWDFNETNFLGSGGQQPVVRTNAENVTSWSGNAVRLNHPDSVQLFYRVAEENGRANLQFDKGTVRLWFKPDWTSVILGGSGPRDIYPSLFALADGIAFWGLYLNSLGNELTFDSGHDQTWSETLAVPIAWQSNQWHQIVLSYWDQSSKIYLDGELTGTARGVTVWPLLDAFGIGADSFLQQARGTFDELETFDYVLSAQNIRDDFRARHERDGDGDGLTDILENQIGSNVRVADNIVLAVLTGDNQIALPGSLLPEPLVVLMTDRLGHPLTNYPVVFATAFAVRGLLVSNSVLVSELVVRTDAEGKAFAFAVAPFSVNSTEQVFARTWVRENAFEAALTTRSSDNLFIFPEAGRYASLQHAFVRCFIPGAVIHYTLNGVNPTEEDPILLPVAQIPVAGTVRLKVRAWTNGVPATANHEAAFVITGTLAAGNDHYLVVSDAGQVWAWGNNAYGQLALATGKGAPIPTVVPVLSNIVAVAAGASHSLALDAEGTVWSWGGNQRGQLGAVQLEMANSPFRISNLSNIIAVASGSDHNIALAADGTVWTWGANDSGQLGNGTFGGNRALPEKIAALPRVVSIASGTDHCLAITESGAVFGWGHNADGEIGDGSILFKNVPALVATNYFALQVSGGQNHSMALTAQRALLGWGSNSRGQLGDGTFISRSAPEPGPGILFDAIAAGGRHSLGIDKGQVFAWGENGEFQLGDGTLTRREIPLPIDSISNMIAIAAGAASSIARGSDGVIWTWGRFDAGSAARAETRPFPWSLTNRLDSDGDGLPDWFEIARGSNVHATDSDFDGRTDYDEWVDGTDPMDSSSFKPLRLGYWRFDDPDFLQGNGQRPSHSTNVQLISGWSGSACLLEGDAQIGYPRQAGNGAPQINPRHGTLRFWLKPAWTSVAWGGSGPGAVANLLGLRDATSLWGLRIIATGDGVEFFSGTGNEDEVYFLAPLVIQSNQWKQLVLTTSPTGSVCFVNGEIASSGSAPGVEIMRSLLEANTIFVGGGSLTPGAGAVAIDELETFNYVMSAAQVRGEFRSTVYLQGGEDFDHDHLSDLAEKSIGTESGNADTDGDGVSDSQEWFYEQTDPLNGADGKPRRLNSWKFDDPSLRDEKGNSPIFSSNVVSTVSWSGRAVALSGDGAALVYGAFGSNGAPLFGLKSGTLRFWYQPAWTSPALGGGGPGAEAVLFGIGDNDPGSLSDFWGLSVDASGSRLQVRVRHEGITNNFFDSVIRWNTNEWHDLALAYSPSNSALFIDGNLVETNVGIPLIAAQTLLDGLGIGSDPLGRSNAQGRLDNVETFNYPLSLQSITADHTALYRLENVGFDTSTAFVTSNEVALNLTGVPQLKMALLINPTNWTEAVWTTNEASPYVILPRFHLPGGDGEYAIWVGFDFMGARTWLKKTIILDTHPPDVRPEARDRVVTSPLLQLTGWSSEALGRIEFQLATMEQTNDWKAGFIIKRYFDSKAQRGTSNEFQCFDIRLEPGTNTITLRALDLAGNITERPYVYLLDTTLDTTPPAMTIAWPQPRALLAGSNVTLRGMVDEPAVTVRARLTSEAGTNEFEGVVERDGRFWIDSLPLTGETNEVLVVATDAAGNSSTTNLVLKKSSLALTVNPIDSAWLKEKKAIVTGTIADRDHHVWVNGVEASALAEGGGVYSWSVAVPVDDGGTAIFDVRAVPNSQATLPGVMGIRRRFNDNPPAPGATDLSVAVDKPVYVRAVRYEEDLHGVSDQTTAGIPLSDYFVHERQRTWTFTTGGSLEAYWTSSPGYDHDRPFGYNYQLVRTRLRWPATDLPPVTVDEQLDSVDGEGPIADNTHRYIDRVRNVPWEHCDVELSGDQPLRFELGPFAFGHYKRKAHTTLELVVGGRQIPEQTQIVQLTANAGEFNSPLRIPQGNRYSGERNVFETEDDFAGDMPIAAENISINGLPISASEDNAYQGITFLEQPIGTTVALEVLAQTKVHDFYALSVTAQPVALRIAIDNNRDGKISTDSADKMSVANPYRFWVNDDYDRWHEVDNGDFEEDDLVADNPSMLGSDQVIDCNFRARDPITGAAVLDSIPSMRDLEDYSRIWLPGISETISHLPKGFSIELAWRNSPMSSTPSIRLFKATEPDGGNRYLTSESIAKNQINREIVPFVGYVGRNQSVNLSQRFRILAEKGTPASDYFLFCGAARGQGELILRIKNSRQSVVSKTSAFLEIKDVKEMFERWTVNDSPSDEPEEYAYPAPDGPNFQFSYDAARDNSLPYIVFVHGWNMKPWDKDRYSETMFKRLYWQGYKGRFGSFRWPTDNKFNNILDVIFDSRNYDRSEFQAWKSAKGLKNHLVRLYVRYPGKVYLLAHSMGSVVAGEALRLAGDNQLVNTYVASQAAIPAHIYDAAVDDLISFDYKHPKLPGGTIHYGPDTPNIYGNWLANTPGAGKRVNFYNANDFALAPDAWEFNGLLKPDAATTRYFFAGSPNVGNLGNYHSGSPDDDPPWNHFGKGPPAGDFHRFDIVNNTVDRYEVFAFAAEPRSKALGATGKAASLTRNLDLQTIWPPDPSNTHDYRAHKWHSAQFRSTYVKQNGYWRALLEKEGFGIK